MKKYIFKTILQYNKQTVKKNQNGEDTNDLK